MLILFETFLGILLLDPHFFFQPYCCKSSCKYLTLRKFQSIAYPGRDTLKKGDLPDPFVRTCSFVMPFSLGYEHTKLMTYLIINLPLAVFYRQSLSCEVIDKSQGDLNSSNSKYFPLCPPWSISNVLLFFEVSTSIFCVLIRQRQSLHFPCFRIFAAPVV